MCLTRITKSTRPLILVRTTTTNRSGRVRTRLINQICDGHPEIQNEYDMAAGFDLAGIIARAQSASRKSGMRRVKRPMDSRHSRASNGKCCSLWMSLVSPSEGPSAFFLRQYFGNESSPNSRSVFYTHNEIHPASDFCTDANNESEHTCTNAINKPDS